MAGPSMVQIPPAPVTAGPAIPSLSGTAPLPPTQFPPFQMVPGLAPPAASAAPQVAAMWLLPPSAQTVPGIVSPVVPEYLTSFEAFQATRVAAQLPVPPLPSLVPAQLQLTATQSSADVVEARLIQLEQLLLHSATMMPNLEW